jgi:acetolactate synthase I/II/III large subunit
MRGPARRPAVCLAQAVGALNQAAGLREPLLAASPVISITGGPDPGSRYRFLYQQVEDFPSFDPVTKLNVRIERADRIPDLVRQAFRVATSGTPGPVHLELPGRLGEAFDATTQDETVGEPRFASYPPYRPAADVGSITDAVGRLAAAERPVIVAGGGVSASSAGPEVVRSPRPSASRWRPPSTGRTRSSTNTRWHSVLSAPTAAGRRTRRSRTPTS